MKIKLWGVRGSLPAPINNQQLRRKLEQLLMKITPDDLGTIDSVRSFLDRQPFHATQTVGGDTTCVEVRSQEHNSLLVFDAGTGIRRLGDSLIRNEGFAEGGKEIHIFISHTHWDHIQGFPFFVPAYIPGNKIHFYSPFEDLQERFERQQLYDHFPQPLEGMASVKEFHTLSTEGSVNIDGITISCFPLNHPGGSFAYRLTENQKTFVFATDAEFTMVQIDELQEYNPFFREADILIFDSQYTLEEAFYKFDWGHTSVSMAVNMAISWNAKKLVMTHHDPSYDDEKLAAILDLALEHRKNMHKNEPEIIQAYEGLEFYL